MTTKLRQYIEGLLVNHKNIFTEWNENSTEITIKKAEQNGFDVTVGMDNDMIYLYTDCGYHDHWHLDQFQGTETALETVFGLVRDLLSENMRIKVMLSNNKPYRWLLQAKEKEEDRWLVESSTGLLLWNYFGRRSEQIFSNSQLSPRDLRK